MKKLGVVLISFGLVFLVSCGVGNLFAPSSSGGYITCNAPYKKCLLLDVSDASNVKLTFPGITLSNFPRLLRLKISYKIYGKEVWKDLQFSKSGETITQDGFTFVHSVSSGRDSELSFILDGTQIIFQIGGGGLTLWRKNKAYSGIVEIAGNFTAIVWAPGANNDFLGINGFRLPFDTIGKPVKWRNAMCKYGECNEPNVLVTWVANNTFHIDY